MTYTTTFDRINIAGCQCEENSLPLDEDYCLELTEVTHRDFEQLWLIDGYLVGINPYNERDRVEKQPGRSWFKFHLYSGSGQPIADSYGSLVFEPSIYSVLELGLNCLKDSLPEDHCLALSCLYLQEYIEKGGD